MPYQSPLHLLDSLHIQPDQINAVGLVQLRKKLLAEFNLTSNITIAVGEKQYTKDEALKAIDQLKEVQNLTDHAAIFQNKPLLAWLENPTAEPLPAKSIGERRWSGQQNTFFDKILAEGLQTYCSFLLKRKQFTHIKEPLAIAFSLPDQWQYGIQGIIYEHIRDITALIDAAKEAPDHTRDVASFGFIINNEWADFLNSLPEGTFWGIINDYCVAAVNYTVAVQHDQRKFVYQITHQLTRTNCDSGLKTTIQNNYQVYKANLKVTKDNHWTSYLIWPAILLAQALVRSCDS